ncbi:Gamma-glutamyltranspeptidase precursor [Thalassoglobus neptunius]|uniref:Glutathione hydrolase proenzyme n=1 Tax=Thalassoglobus neptunius TaxID=1938619 RepID=A0A5C5X648_9PLAN|nr:gamma-glutamyltransferase [Thalassoglobus neptunius]TWT57811.1 Gamma-glutamyltranspeptidase precursor [Thalassoglobus neptunius]
MVFPRHHLTTLLSTLLVVVCSSTSLSAGSIPERFPNCAVVTQSELASQVGRDVMRDGGNAIDAAVASAFALAVTHPAAGNIGGGGFLVYRGADGSTTTYDFREVAPRGATAEMWIDEDGNYDRNRHHSSALAVGVPGSVAGLHLAWTEHGKLPWKRLVEPAIELAEQGFEVTPGLAQSLAGSHDRFKISEAALDQFTNNGKLFVVGDRLVQKDLAKSLERIALKGPAGFYEGKTADLIVKQMKAMGGLIDHEDLKAYRPIQRSPVTGDYRGHKIISMPPPSSGGVTLIQMLNILENVNLREFGAGSANSLHWMAESMRLSYLDRARHLGDPDFVADQPIDLLISKQYAKEQHLKIAPDQAGISEIEQIQQLHESPETTHLSVVDGERNAVALTTTLEYSYGSGIVVSGGGFLLNNEMGDFNPVEGVTTLAGQIGTPANLTAPGKRMLSSMTPTIVERNGELLMVTGSPGGRTIINTVLQTIVNVIDHEMNAQDAVNYGRIHQQWLPDRIRYERNGFSPDTLNILLERGHVLDEAGAQGSAQIIVVDPENEGLQTGVDHRRPGAAAAGF